MPPRPETAGEPESPSLLLESALADAAMTRASGSHPVKGAPAGGANKAQARSAHSPPALPPGLAPQPRPRARWEDYLSPSTTGISQPTPVVDNVLHLETPRTYGSPSTTAEVKPAPAPELEEHGPTFEVPELPVWTPPMRRTSRVKLAAIVVFSVIWAALAAMPMPTPQRDPEAMSVTSVPPGRYARYSRAATGGLPILWMAQLDRTLIVVVTPAWQKMPTPARVALLRELDEIGESPREVLVMNKQSDLLAEIYERRYHIYR